MATGSVTWLGDVTGNGLPVLSRSHKSVRVGVKGSTLDLKLEGAKGDFKPANVLVETKRTFVDVGRPLPRTRGVRQDPADRVAAQ